MGMRADAGMEECFLAAGVRKQRPERRTASKAFSFASCPVDGEEPSPLTLGGGNQRPGVRINVFRVAVFTAAGE
jgi:hypothetical protein